MTDEKVWELFYETLGDFSNGESFEVNLGRLLTTIDYLIITQQINRSIVENSKVMHRARLTTLYGFPDYKKVLPRL